VVLCYSCPAKLLVERSLWTKLGIPVEWKRSNVANCPVDCGFLHWCMGWLPPYHWNIVEETLLAFASVCYWARSPEVVSDVVGYYVHWTESPMGRHRGGHRSSQDGLVGWKVALALARCVRRYPRCRIWYDAVTGMSFALLRLT
jgi:hypothetical protein